MLDALKKTLGLDSPKEVPKVSTKIEPKNGSVERVREDSEDYLIITFPYPLKIPQKNELYRIKKIKVKVKNDKKSLNSIKSDYPKGAKMNFHGALFPAESLLLKIISDVIRGKDLSKVSIRYQEFQLNDLYWSYTFPNSFKGKTFNLSNNQELSSLEDQPLLMCKFEPSFFEEVGIVSIDEKNKELPNGFSWDKYRKISNQFGSIQRFEQSKAWLYIEFSKESKNLFGNDIPNFLFLCTQTYNGERIYEDGFQELIRNQENLEHPTLGIPVKLIDSEKLASALTYIIYGNSPKVVDGKINNNFGKLNLPKNTFILISTNNFDYIDFSKGEIFFNESRIKERVDVLVYRTEPPRYD